VAGIDNLTPFDSERASAAGKVGGANKKGKKHINTWIQELLEDEDFEADLIDSKKGLVEFKGAPLKAIIMAQRHKAVNGDQKAVDLLFKYGWPAKSETDVTSGGEQLPVLVQFIDDTTTNDTDT
jgi:hypothetical protein